MNPAVQSGLYNPDKYVRGGAVEAMGKTYGVAAMKKAEREERDAKARMQHHASDEADVPTRSGTLTDEQRALFDELVDKVKLGEAGEWETAPVEEHEAQGGPPGPEREAPKPRVEKPAAKQKKKVRSQASMFLSTCPLTLPTATPAGTVGYRLVLTAREGTRPRAHLLSLLPVLVSALKKWLRCNCQRPSYIIGLWTWSRGIVLDCSSAMIPLEAVSFFLLSFSFFDRSNGSELRFFSLQQYLQNNFQT